MPVDFHRLARAELRAAQRASVRHGPVTARRFFTAITAAIARIDARPLAGSPAVGVYRWVRVGRSPYLLYYGPLTATDLRVYAFAHTSRRPGYWLRRVNRP